MEYAYKLRIKKYNDYRDEIDALVANNPGQMSFDQYQYIYDTVSSKNGCNFLIFGLGKDSQLWIEANKNGNTVFVEDNIEWINFCKSIPNLDVRHVNYTNVGHDYEKLLEDYKLGINNLNLDLHNDIRQKKWDIILVDGPANYGFDVPCRMKSIYETYNLSKLNNDIDIFVHDVNKIIIKTYTNYFYKEYNLLSTIGECICGDDPFCVCNILKHFKKESNNG